MAILIFALIGVLIVCVIYALTGSTREGVGRVTRSGATLSQNVSPFGDSVILYDGTTLHCVAATGGNEWSYQIGTNADYDATEKRIVAWSGNDLYILNNRGRLIYNNKMSDTVQFASAGDEYVAVFVGEADNGVVSVINSSGQIVDNITVSNQTMLDIGFFYTTRPGVVSGLRVVPLYREPVYIMVSWDHPLAQKKGLKYEALEGMQFMYPHDTCCFVGEFLPMLEKMGVHLSKTTFLGGVQLVVEQVRKEGAMTLAPHCAAQHYHDAYGLVRLDMDEEPIWAWENIV